MYKTNFGFTRFLLAIFVAIAHGVYDLNVIDEKFDYGRLSVLIFFILSGLVISKAASNFYLNKPFSFIVNRLITLVPPIIIIIAVVSLFFYIFEEDSTISEYTNLLANLYGWFPGKFLLDGFLLGKNQIEVIPILWSIRIEFLFYFIVFFFLLFNFFFKIKKNNKKFFFLTYLISISLFTICFLFIENFKLSEYFGYFIYFLIGYFIYKIYDINENQPPSFFLKYSVLLIIGLVSFFQCSPNLRPIEGYFYQELNIFMLFRSVFVLIIVYFSIFRSQLFIISKNCSKFLGGMSYFIYLIHFPVFFILNNYFKFNFFLYFFFSIIFSGIFFYIYDSLIKNFKNKVRGRPL